MANWLIEQKIALRRGEQAPQVWPNALMLCGDNNAHTWRVTVLDGGEAAQVTGSVTGYFVRPDGNTVTVQGSMAGNVASVVLAQACYAQEGDVKAVLRLSVSTGAKVTLAALILPVRNVLTDSIIDPGNVIPSLDDLLAQVAAMEALNDDVSAAEAGRVAAEQERVTAEEGREEAEDARASAESGRASAEQARAAAEAERVANEDERQQQLTNAINAAEADADRAEAAADAAETLIAMPPLFSNTPPTEAPTLNKLWIDTGVSPTMLRRWRGADVPTGREYQQTISADTGSASLSIDNAQGQLRSVALEMGCVAKQAGSGDPSPENIRAISGQESVDVRACGKNLYDVNDRKTFSDGVTVDADGWVTVTADNSAGSSNIFKNCYTYPSLAIRPSTQYAVVCEIVQINVTGQLTFSIVDLYNDPQALSQFAQAFSMTVNESTQTGTRIQVLTSRADLSDAGSMLRTYVAFIPGASGTIKFRLSVLADTAITAETFVYEPYRSMGGGTVTPTEPIYGLPDAKDTVEVSTDGDVTVTRRTRVLELDGTENWVTYETSVAENVRFRLNPDENIDIELPANNDTVANILCSHYTAVPNTQNGTFNCVNGVSVHAIEKSIMVFDNNYATENVDTWKSYLAAQAAAGTPVTIVYELAEPETEALTAISPIAPQAGQLNLTTDADALTATIYGSGWDTISDQTGLLATIAQLTARVAALEAAAVSTINNTTEG